LIFFFFFYVDLKLKRRKLI